MSTTLNNLSGLIEKPISVQEKSEYKETDVNLTVFYGGKNRGKSLQLGFVNELGDYSHIQLDNENVKLLIKQLVENFL